MNWKELFSKHLTDIESNFDRLTDNFKFRLGYTDPIQILPYRTYGTLNRLYLKGRVLAIYIRDVQLAEREKIAMDISKELLTGHKLEMVIVDNTTEAADHAAKTGLIYREALPAIEQDKAEDKGQAPGKEEAKVVE